MSIQEYQLSEKVRGKLNGDFVEIIDNLTEGGANKALSAEQGKVIKAFVDKNAKDILDELSRKATNISLGNVMVDGTTIAVDADGKISATQPKYVETDYGFVAMYPFSIEAFAGTATDGLQFQLSVDDMGITSRMFDIDISVIPVGVGDVAHRIDMHISFERDAGGDIINASYSTENSNFKKDGLQVYATDNDGENFVTVEIRKPNTYTGTSTCTVLVNKIAVIGTEDFTAVYSDIERFGVELSTAIMGQKILDFKDDSGESGNGGGVIVVDDATTGGRDVAWSAEQGKELYAFVMAETMKLVDIYDGLDSNAQNKVLSAAQGKILKAMIDAIATNPQNSLNGTIPTTFTNVFKPVFHTSGVYRGTVPVDNGVDPIDEDMNLPMGDYTVTVNVTAVPTGGFIKNYTAMKTGIETQGGGKYATFIYELLHREDRIDSTGNAYSAQGKWNIFTPSSYATLRQEHGQLKTDVQTLFTNWANETKNAVTALSHKGVTLAPDATMKQIVTGIEDVQTGIKHKELSINATNSPKSFRYVGGNTNTSLSYITINIDALGFDPVAIFVESAGFDGNATSVKTDAGTLLSARLVDFNTNTHVGTNKWLELGTNGFPSNGNLDIPVAKIGAYTVTVYGA